MQLSLESTESIKLPDKTKNIFKIISKKKKTNLVGHIREKKFYLLKAFKVFKILGSFFFFF